MRLRIGLAVLAAAFFALAVLPSRAADTLPAKLSDGALSLPCPPSSRARTSAEGLPNYSGGPSRAVRWVRGSEPTYPQCRQATTPCAPFQLAPGLRALIAPSVCRCASSSFWMAVNTVRLTMMRSRVPFSIFVNRSSVLTDCL